MKINKLTLDLDALQVASFATQAPGAGAQGTVMANEAAITPIVVWLSTYLPS